MKVKGHTRKVGNKTIKVKGHHRKGPSRKKNYGKRVKRSLGKRMKSVKNSMKHLLRRHRSK